jgi:anti-sigma regulatory factor (Ser/Thr protein kinase)
MAEITIPACVDRLVNVLGFLENAMRDAGLDEKQQNKVNVAVEEIFVNIAHYAYPSSEGDVKVCVSADADKIIIKFKDAGTPYNPLAKPDPDTSLSADEREIGGLGILMVKRMMDEVSYEYGDRQNILTIVKKRADSGS